MKHSIGYAKVASPSNTDPEPIKRALWSKYIVATGSKYGDWSKIQKTGVYSEKKTPSGHIFQINGWDDNKVFPSGEKGGFHSPNSWGGVGDFWIPYSMIGSLYSIYIQLDPSDAEALRDIRNVRAKAWADLAQSKGIWNGSNPETLASPEEIRIMLQRALDIMGGRTRQYWVDTFNDFILRGKDLMKIWNEKDGKRIATNDELALMFTRAITRNPDQSKLTLSRFQVAAVIARDFIPKIS